MAFQASRLPGNTDATVNGPAFVQFTRPGPFSWPWPAWQPLHHAAIMPQLCSVSQEALPEGVSLVFEPLQQIEPRDG